MRLGLTWFSSWPHSYLVSTLYRPIEVTESNFRKLLLLSLVSGLASVAVSLSLESTLPIPLREYLNAEYEAEWTTYDSIMLTCSLIILPLFIWNWIELYWFKPRSRLIALGLTLISLPLLSLFGGVRISTWQEDMLYTVSCYTWGALLICMYLPPIDEKFGKTDWIVWYKHLKHEMREKCPGLVRILLATLVFC